MKTAILKYPFKFQDLAILEAVKQHVDPNTHVIPVDFSNTDIDLTKADIILGLNKPLCKVLDFDISNCKSYNNRDLSYYDRLRFHCKIPSLQCIGTKNAIKSLRLGSLEPEDRLSRTGAYSSLDVHSILESYTGFKGDMSEEYDKKSSILGKWLKAVGSYKNNFTFCGIDNEILKESIVKAVNNHLSEEDKVNDYMQLEELLNSSETSCISPSHRTTLKAEIPKFLESNVEDSSRLLSNLLSFINEETHEEWVSIWIDSIYHTVDRSIYYTELWNSCDFSIEGVVINTTGESIPNWKTFAKIEEDVLFFVTPETGTTNWSVISVYPSENPLVDSDLYYWMHVSKFLAKFTSLDKANHYVHILTSVYSDTSSLRGNIEEEDWGKIILKDGLNSLGY